MLPHWWPRLLSAHVATGFRQGCAACWSMRRGPWPVQFLYMYLVWFSSWYCNWLFVEKFLILNGSIQHQIHFGKSDKAKQVKSLLPFSVVHLNLRSCGLIIEVFQAVCANQRQHVHARVYTHARTHNTHTHTHTHAHTHTRAHAHTHAHTNTHAHKHKHTHTYTHTYRCTHRHTHTHTHTYTHTYTHIQTDIYTHLHTDAHIHMHTYTHTHVHKLSLSGWSTNRKTNMPCNHTALPPHNHPRLCHTMFKMLQISLMDQTNLPFIVNLLKKMDSLWHKSQAQCVKINLLSILSTKLVRTKKKGRKRKKKDHKRALSKPYNHDHDQSLPSFLSLIGDVQTHLDHYELGLALLLTSQASLIRKAATSCGQNSRKQSGSQLAFAYLLKE